MRLVPAAALLLGAALPALAQAPRRTYLHEARDTQPDAVQLLSEVEQALAGDEAERAARGLDRLLELTHEGGAASALVEAGPHRWVGLRAAALQRLDAFSGPAHEALRRVQEQGAGALRLRDRPAPAALLARRFPCAGDAREALYQALGRALEGGERGRARALRERLLRAHPAAAQETRLLAHDAALALLAGDPAAVGTALIPLRGREEAKDLLERFERARQQLAARPAPVAPSQPAPPTGARLVAKAEVLLAEPVGGASSYCAALSTVAGERVLVSNGAQLLVLDARGKVLSLLPGLAEAAALPPPEQTHFVGRAWTRNGLFAAPLVLERWLAPARTTSQGPDASFAGTFYSLLLGDLATGRLLWWDGDAGPVLPEAAGSAGPPGSDRAPVALLERLRRAHVVAVTGDAERIYAALLFQGDDLELGLFAWELDAGAQALVLRPAWSSVTHLFAAERAGDLGGDEAAVHPEVAAALAMDDAGHLFVTTDVGVAACVDAQDGDVLWLQDAPPQRPTRPMGMRQRVELAMAPPPAPPEPARPLGGGLVAFLQGNQLVAASVQAGEPAWSVVVGDTPRTLLLGERLVAYAMGQLQLLHARSGQLLFTLQLPGERCAGEGLPWGGGLLMPVLDGNASRVRRVELRGGGRPGAGEFLILGSEWACPNHRGPFNLTAVGDLLVATSSRRVSLLTWEQRQR